METEETEDISKVGEEGKKNEVGKEEKEEKEQERWRDREACVEDVDEDTHRAHSWWVDIFSQCVGV